MKVTDGIYAYEWTDYFENNCNSYYIGGEARILIDPGLLKYVPDLLRRMAADGIGVEDIRCVINTHSHPDHFEGSLHFKDTETVIGMHRDEIAFLSGQGGSLYGLFGLAAPEAHIEMVLQEGELVVGGERFEIVHLPGHSPGSIGIYDPGRKALFAGDVIFDQSVGRTDFPGGSGAQLKRSILKAAKLDVEYLLPGHMGIVQGRQAVETNYRLVIQQIFPYI
ncbi:MAG TPA: MBL fold metallo-hydrolase [Syntrophales bacterium]|nr:MBL fold metallo-hydrolase [Syntrophales bacterium]HOM07438.1 MBL fold metallo-hydrolase [Syntrophales bacterium]HON99927.1 MBL fold metallo-hydrolase [Syntrophales bacterium]HPC01419.1 MBL fold metallo-hydrolase [Syntrophales bacterium]HPQ06949.1 MBL fold metallo-hydrolase [Syntrophales bacterium]